jgi:hypothetical protein
LTRDPRNFCAYLERFKALGQFCVEGGEGQEKRAAARFALIALAGELATEYGITGWPEGAAIEAAAAGFEAWRAERGHGTTNGGKYVSRFWHSYSVMVTPGFPMRMQRAKFRFATERVGGEIQMIRDGNIYSQQLECVRPRRGLISSGRSMHCKKPEHCRLWQLAVSGHSSGAFVDFQISFTT